MPNPNCVLPVTGGGSTLLLLAAVCCITMGLVLTRFHRRHTMVAVGLLALVASTLALSQRPTYAGPICNPTTTTTTVATGANVTGTTTAVPVVTAPATTEPTSTVPATTVATTTTTISPFGRIAGVYRRQSAVTPAGVMPGANVDLIEAGPDGIFETGDETVVSTTSGLDGSYLFDSLNPGLYRVAGTALPTVDESAEFHFVPNNFGPNITSLSWTGSFGTLMPPGTVVTLTNFATDGTPIGSTSSNADPFGQVTFSFPYTAGIATYQLSATIAGHVGTTPRFNTLDFSDGINPHDSGSAFTSPWAVVSPADLTVIAGQNEVNYDLRATATFALAFSVP
jgi:hypothetical protein